ncbi:MAG: phosphoribosylformylglycinamidine synthase subunit PurS [Candidatus Nitrosopelagicus sp.]|jgi:phosphoribosylformylglycinamidine synthase|nr:phosphoribosylformylglycinamidine synthase subunit PurS [Candidatus Nitrosopelagicus sp.]NWJ89827.1 phosphoribosylformylglycinamidine synthase subunit PurS [Marine Group I thaumarchaeote]PXF27921.1 MAG: phosphoribosylformylglycinamidine synthase, purS protein [Nitrososphaerota archaeon]HIA10148.1 phosphoribosylformylglycinamidine synthase subunit PurS [Candidatus Nitrosopelagicus sp.]HIA96907.1 phosphoribosylformylglycinamidine synthase subunit PurS [Candidatus Nitrosopelagicus sp.]
MPTYLIHVTIENKPGISDPEGETILNDLVLKGNYSSITKIRSGKILKFQIDEKNKKSAEEKIRKLCDELRIFNPLVSKVSFEVFEN